MFRSSSAVERYDHLKRVPKDDDIHGISEYYNKTSSNE